MSIWDQVATSQAERTQRSTQAANRAEMKSGGMLTEKAKQQQAAKRQVLQAVAQIPGGSGYVPGVGHTDELLPQHVREMSPGERRLAGVGAGMTDVARNTVNMLPYPPAFGSDAAVAEQKRLDAPLLATSEGAQGNFLGQTATTMPLAAGVVGGPAKLAAHELRRRGMQVPRMVDALRDTTGITNAAGQGAVMGAVGAEPGNRATGAAIGGVANPVGMALMRPGKVFNRAMQGRAPLSESAQKVQKAGIEVPLAMSGDGAINRFARNWLPHFGFSGGQAKRAAKAASGWEDVVGRSADVPADVRKYPLFPAHLRDTGAVPGKPQDTRYNLTKVYREAVEPVERASFDLTGVSPALQARVRAAGSNVDIEGIWRRNAKDWGGGDFYKGKAILETINDVRMLRKGLKQKAAEGDGSAVLRSRDLGEAEDALKELLHKAPNNVASRVGKTGDTALGSYYKKLYKNYGDFLDFRDTVKAAPRNQGQFTAADLAAKSEANNPLGALGMRPMQQRANVGMDVVDKGPVDPRFSAMRGIAYAGPGEGWAKAATGMIPAGGILGGRTFEKTAQGLPRVAPETLTARLLRQPLGGRLDQMLNYAPLRRTGLFETIDNTVGE